jgi:hypothetical protein
LFGDSVNVGLCPRVDFAQFSQDRIERLGVGVQEFLRREIKLIIGDDVRAVGERPGLRRSFRRRLERIPDNPRIDRAAFERSTGIGRGQEYRRDVGIFDAGSSSALTSR